MTAARPTVARKIGPREAAVIAERAARRATPEPAGPCGATLGSHTCVLPAGPGHGGLHSDRASPVPFTWRDSDPDVATVLEAARAYREAALVEKKLLSVLISQAKERGEISARKSKSTRKAPEVKSCPPPKAAPSKRSAPKRKPAAKRAAPPASAPPVETSASPVTSSARATSAPVAPPATRATATSWPPRSRELWSRVTAR